MHIQYQLKFLDVVLFQAVHQFLNPAVQGLFLLLTWFIFQSEMNDTPTTLHAAAVAGSLYAIMWALQFTFNPVYLISRKNTNVLTQHTIELQQKGVLEETRFTQTLVQWPGVARIVSRPGFVALYISPHMAHVIPNRAFSSSAHRAEFISFVRDRLNAIPGDA